MEKILTVEQVAEILQVKAITVREMFRDKRIRGFKVGKAWRTTERMLQEDIEAIARGDSPADLPMLGTEAPAKDVPVPKRGRKQVKPVDGEATAKAPTNGAAEGKPARKKPAKESSNGSAAHKKPAAEEAEPDVNDTQQLLF